MLARMELPAIQSFLRDRQIDTWLVYDFRGSNPILAQLLPGQRWTTRRAMLVIPAQGEAHIIVHNIDAPQFAACGFARRIYNTWQQWQQFVREATQCEGASGNTIAMEYSPLGELPAVSFVDGGTLDFIRSLGVEVVSSEDAIQFAVARWSPDALTKHHHAATITAGAKDSAFKLIRKLLAANESITEYGVQQHILKHLTDAGLDPDHPPIVGVNEHSGDPHYEVPATGSSPIRRGDWVLIDLWARVPGNGNVFADITWMAFCGDRVPDEHRRVWEAVKTARDAAFTKVVDAWNTKTPVHG